MRRRAKDEHKEVRRIHRKEEEEAPKDQVDGSHLYCLVALITSNEGDEGCRPVYGEDKQDMGKDCSAADAVAAYATLVIVGGVVSDWYEDTTEE